MRCWSPRALGTDQSGQYLLVVGPNDVVEYRAVKVGSRVGDLRVVEGAIKPEDRVVVEGLLCARPDMKVAPKPAATPSPAATTALNGTARIGAPPPQTNEEKRSAPSRRRQRMFSKFFIERPIFANVIAIVTMLVGIVALVNLPIEAIQRSRHRR